MSTDATSPSQSGLRQSAPPAEVSVGTSAAASESLGSPLTRSERGVRRSMSSSTSALSRNSRQLSKRLSLRLSFARLKVERGWSGSSIDEIESLWQRNDAPRSSKRTRTDSAESRKSSVTSNATTVGDSLAAGQQGLQVELALPPHYQQQNASSSSLVSPLSTLSEPTYMPHSASSSQSSVVNPTSSSSHSAPMYSPYSLDGSHQSQQQQQQVGATYPGSQYDYYQHQRPRDNSAGPSSAALYAQSAMQAEQLQGQRPAQAWDLQTRGVLAAPSMMHSMSAPSHAQQEQLQRPSTMPGPNLTQMPMGQPAYTASAVDYAADGWSAASSPYDWTTQQQQQQNQPPDRYVFTGPSYQQTYQPLSGPSMPAPQLAASMQRPMSASHVQQQLYPTQSHPGSPVADMRQLQAQQQQQAAMYHAAATSPQASFAPSYHSPADQQRRMSSAYESYGSPAALVASGSPSAHSTPVAPSNPLWRQHHLQQQQQQQGEGHDSGMTLMSPANIP